jgi:2-amino-4-hydroxy-6-hydroxymethyldihydropteridine diphosphokinase
MAARPNHSQNGVAAYIGLGSNIGEPVENLGQAVALLQEIPGLLSIEASKVYFTEPQGVKDQPWFANQVVKAMCSGDWTPRGLLQQLLDLERSMGRQREERWGPRRIDLDLLMFGATEISDPDMVLPHPRIGERAFVLVPLLELEPDLCLPDGRRLRTMLGELSCRLQGDIIWQD